MAVSLRERVRENRVGHVTQANFNLNLGTYATNGVEFNPADYVEGARILQVDIPGQNGYAGEYDYTNKKIKLWDSDTANEVANATDLSAKEFRVTAIIE